MDELGTFNDGDKAEASSVPTNHYSLGEATDRLSHLTESGGQTSEKGSSGTLDPSACLPLIVSPLVEATSTEHFCEKFRFVQWFKTCKFIENE